jgi:hypothetical protein
MTKYAVMTADSWRMIARGFKTWEGAYSWMLNHDWGQYEEEGGLTVRPYTA